MNICTLIEDILPLYTDGLLQEDTAELVKKHLATCPACSAKEKQLKAALPVPPPNPEEKNRLRRIKRKVHLRALLISAGSILLAVGIFLAAYLPFYFQRQAEEEEIRIRESAIREIESALRGSNIIVDAPFEITQAEADGKRVKSDGISFLLPTDNFREIEDGYYGNYEIYEGAEQLVDTVSVTRYESYDQLSSYAHPYGYVMGLSNLRAQELYDRGYELMKLRGVENNYLNLALAAARFDFDVIHNDPTNDELALAVFFSYNYRYLLVNGPSKAHGVDATVVSRESSDNKTVFLANTMSNIRPCWFSISPTKYYEIYGKLTGFLTYTTISTTLSGGSKSVNTYWRAVFKGADERYYYIIDITDNPSTISSADGSWNCSLEQIQSLLESIRFE